MDDNKKMGKVLEFKPRKKGRTSHNRNVRAIPKEQSRTRNTQKKMHKQDPTEKGNLLENKTQKNIAYFLLLCFILYVFKSYF